MVFACLLQNQISLNYFQLKLACVMESLIPLYLVEHDAHVQFVTILTKYQKQLPKCSIINFTGTLEELEKYVSMGFYIAVYGMYQLYNGVARMLKKLRTSKVD